MHLAVVLNFFVTLQLDSGTVGQLKFVNRVLEVLLLDQDTLERLRVEAEGRASLESSNSPNNGSIMHDVLLNTR